MLKGNEKIDAIAWAAKKQSLSYGIFSASLTEKYKENIYAEYERRLAEKQKREEERLRNCKRKNK